MTKLIDTHAHLEMGQFDTDREQTISRAINGDISLIIDVGTDLTGSRKAVELANSYDEIYASVGIHPHEATGMDDEVFDSLKELLQEKRVIALGEIGLDYFKAHSPVETQKAVFKKLIRLANEIKKPIIVHSRDAKTDTLILLKEEKAHKVGGILHCFSGDLDMAFKLLDMGFYISFSGPITYPNAKELRKVVKEIPLDKILIETDSPFLAPQQHRGKRNEPSYVKFVAEKIAEIKEITVDEIAHNVANNVYTLFRIGKAKDRDIIAYKIRNSLYLNLTNECTNACIFCSRETDPVVRGYDLRLKNEPSAAELIKEIGDPKRFDEIVFCGFGEPTIRLEVLKEVAVAVKTRGGKIRVNTNGHGNLIHNRNILPELKGVVDSISISLNSENESDYNRLCHPQFQKNGYEGVKNFIKESVKFIPNVTVSVVAVPEEINLSECSKIAKEMGTNFKIRDYNVVG